MITRKDLGRIIGDRFTQRGGKRIPYYLGEWMVDYVFEAVKIGLVEDGVVNIRSVGTFRRVDVPEHKKRMPNDSYIIIPPKSKLKVEFRDSFVDDVNKEKYRETIDKKYPYK